MEIIPVNTQVNIRAEGLLTKMANRFYGPYTVIGQTEGGNYVLKNALNEEMKNSFPRQKLKIVETIETDGEINLEIDKVIDSKIENNQEFYLVKWKNSTDQDWLPITAFNSVDCISAYNKEKAFQSEILTRRADDTAKNNNSNTTISNKRKNIKVPLVLAKDQEKTINKPLITKRGRGRPRIHPLVSTIISSIIFIISFILKVNLVNSIEVKSDFIFCDTNDRTLIDINKSCRKEKSHEERIPISSKDGRIKALIDFDIEEKFYIFDHAKHLVSGKAYECSMTKTTITTYQNFFGYNSLSDLEETNLILTEQMCEQLVKTKMCNNEAMTCIDNNCRTDFKITKRYNWLETTKLEVINCFINERYLIADKLDDNIFGSLTCKPTDGACALQDSFVIWNTKEIIHRCPLYYVADTNVIREGNFLISNNDNMIFNIVERVVMKSCNNILFYKTNQNLFLTHDNESINLPFIENEASEINKLTLSEIDMHQYKNFESQRHMAYELCLVLENILKIAALHEDKFFKALAIKLII